MSAFPAGYRFHFLPQVDSTNIHAMECLYAGLARGGDVFYTDFQRQGKGQRGKNWISQPNESILMSLVLDSAPLSTSQSFRISAMAALGVKNFLESLVNEKVYIKWPNDLFIGDRKAGGILIENIVQRGSLRWSVVGIGLNMNQAGFAESLPGAVSLGMITGLQYDCGEQVKQLTGFIDRSWQNLLSGNWPEIIAAYNEALYGRGKIKRLRRGSVVIPCQIKRVNSHGLLVAGENDEWHFAHGEVEWLVG